MHPPISEMMWINPGSTGVTSPLLQVHSRPSSGLYGGGSKRRCSIGAAFSCYFGVPLECGASLTSTWQLDSATTRTSCGNWLFTGVHVDPRVTGVEHLPEWRARPEVQEDTKQPLTPAALYA